MPFALDRLVMDQGVVPAFWWFDVRQALLASEQQQQREIASTAAFLHRLGRLPIVVDHWPDEAVLFDLVRRHRLTLHDACYFELSLRLGMPLATINPDLKRMAAQVGIALLTVQ
jgi:predicted nucleic acid-binding protein